LEQWANNRWLGEVHRLRREYDRAEEHLGRAVAIPAASPHRPAELVARIDLALCQAERGAPGTAREHLDRAGTLMTPQEDWRGLTGRYALAEAVILAAEARLSDAESRYEHALDLFRRRSLPWEEAEALLLWSRALRGAGESGRADELVDAALAIYRRCRAGAPWVDRVREERARSTTLPVK
jgi:tetratricopeptide (TPR) repeat protein